MWNCTAICLALTYFHVRQSFRWSLRHYPISRVRDKASHNLLLPIQRTDSGILYIAKLIWRLFWYNFITQQLTTFSYILFLLIANIYEMQQNWIEVEFIKLYALSCILREATLLVVYCFSCTMYIQYSVDYTAHLSFYI